MRSHIRWNLCKIIPGRSQGLTPPRNHNNVSCGPIVDGRLDRKSARTSINLQQNVLSTGVLSIYFVDYWDSKTLHFPCIARFSRFLYIICITGYNRMSYFSKSCVRRIPSLDWWKYAEKGLFSRIVASYFCSNFHIDQPLTLLNDSKLNFRSYSC